MCDKFDPDTLLKISAADQLSEQDKQMIPQALEMLKSNPMRSFRIEIAADSLVQMDESQEKQDRMEMLGAVGQYLEKALPIIQSSPDVAPMIIELMKFGVTAFKVGKGVEGMIDETLDKIKASIQQKQGQLPQPSPEQLKIQAQQQDAEKQRQFDAQFAKDSAQVEIGMKQAQLQFEGQMEQQRLATEERMARMQTLLDQQFERWKAELQAATEIQKANISAKAATDNAATQAATREISQEVRP
jgi:hypothetical protein